MNAPPFIIGAALIFSGWLNGSLWLAMIIGLAIEAHRFIPWRLELSREQFRSAWNVTVLLFFAIAAFFVVTEPSKAVAAMIRWAPAALLPMMAVISYSTAGKVDLDILSVIAQNKVRREGEAGRQGTTLAYPFLFLCILSASASAERSSWFYAGSVLFLAWALWGVRSRSVSMLVWIALLLLSGALGLAGHVGLRSLQGKVEQLFTAWYTPERGDEGTMDPKFSVIGGIGSRKLSNRIALRVELVDKAGAPLLLREAAYTAYRNQIWSSGNSPETPVHHDGTGMWLIGEDPNTEPSMTIHASPGTGKTALPLPLNAVRIEGLPAAAMSRNRLGTVTVADGTGITTYRVFNNRSGQSLDKPDDKDVAVPENEARVLRTLAAELGLSSKKPVRAMESLAAFFASRFQYALPQTGDQAVMPLTEFLLSKRAGHCEYFATATVLLLRAAGIPARYAVGYAVREYSDIEKMYIVRSRHAHAWCLVYVDGAWRDFDTTPPSWIDIEDTQSPLTTYVSDLWQRTVLLIPEWRRGFSVTRFRSFGIWGLGAAAVIVAWRISKTRRKQDRKDGNDIIMQRPPGSDSEFYTVEDALMKQGLIRQPWESTIAWLQKIEQQQVLSVEQSERLCALIELHNRYRFDPNGLSREEREALSASVRTWLDREQEQKRSQ